MDGPYSGLSTVYCCQSKTVIRFEAGIIPPRFRGLLLRNGDYRLSQLKLDVSGSVETQLLFLFNAEAGPAVLHKGMCPAARQAE